MRDQYEILVKGETPLLMHWDNIEWADEMEAWKKDPANKAKSKAGDDRTPAWRWMGSLYHDGEYIAMPQEPLMKALMKAGVDVPTGKGQKTFKSQTQSGIIPLDPFFPFQTSVGRLLLSDVWKLREEEMFAVHAQRVREFGMSLYVKRAPVASSKHIRVRPRFDEWSFSAQLLVVDEMITEEILASLLSIAGERHGLCDWRPSAPKSPGPFGRFTADVKRVS